MVALISHPRGSLGSPPGRFLRGIRNANVSCD